MWVPPAPAIETNINFQIEIVPADGTGLLSGASGDFGTSPFFSSSRASHCSPASIDVGCRDRNTMAHREISSWLRMPWWWCFGWFGGVTASERSAFGYSVISGDNSSSEIAHTGGPFRDSMDQQGRTNATQRGEPRCSVNTARFCVFRASPRCALPPSSRAKPAPARPHLKAGIRHAPGPVLW
jgi:hypothetical protein